MTAATCDCPPAAHVSPRLDRLATLIQAEFGEMPGMKLTRAQFRRLWCLTASEETGLLDRLIRTNVLTVGRDGFIRRT
jgi:hypothetical protein